MSLAVDNKKGRRLSRLYTDEATVSIEGREKAKTDKGSHQTESFEAPKKIGYEDMTKMEDMTLDAVLTNLKERYQNDLIYTYTASILVAINPFKRLPIYGPKWVKYYKGKRLGLLAPHIYAVAEASYTAMTDHKRNQAVLVSGESGAGKTECTKLILQFLSARTDRQSNIETMVLESVPVLEAFGNAKTSRNDNSSRFGKFIEIQFDQEYFITGSKIIPYLLEKSRLVGQNKGERNYHIFYQLTEGMAQAEKDKLFLKNAKDYDVLNQTGCYTIKDVNESEELSQLRKALKLFQIDDDICWEMFKIVASHLHLTNLKWKEVGAEGSTVKDDASKACATAAAKLLGVDTEKLIYALSHKRIQMRSEIIHKPLNPEQAAAQTAAFGKYLYAELFIWMVNKLNACTHTDVYTNFIGVLDIFGFEHFEFNTFEQFLINFCNEKLQHFFNHHIFTLEQLEYEKEKVDWTVIEFKDNQACLDLIEKRRPVGILAVLDEECRFPKATDETFIGKLHSNFEKGNEYYKKPRLAKMNFTVVHYAGEVEYDVSNWRDKNKDEVPEHLNELVRGSEDKFIAILYTPEGMEDGAELDDKKKKEGKATLGTQFRDQLNALMSMLGTCEPYFIRCVKPNEKKVPELFDDKLIYNQLLYAGMLETIRIRRMGYPIRYELDQFWKRFRCICPEVAQSRGDYDKSCRDLIRALGIKTPIDTQVGLTKVFLKQHVANDLEDRRNVALTATIIKLQTWTRYAFLRVNFVEKCHSAHALQTWWRMAHRRKFFIDAHNKTIVAQSWWRMILAMKERKKLIEKKRAEEEERRRKEEEERKRLEKELGKEKAAAVLAEREAEQAAKDEAEREKLRAIAAGEIVVGEDNKEDEEAKKAAEEKKKKKEKKERPRESIMMKKGEEIEVPINVDGRITMGLGWKGGQWDLDGSCLMFRYKQHRDDVYYYKPRSKDNAVVHKGGYAGMIRGNTEEGDAEQIDVSLHKISAKTNTLLFVVTVFSPEGNFSTVKDAYVRLVDNATQSEYCRYTIEQSGTETAKIMCKLFRHGFSKWRLQALGAPGEGRLYKHMISKVDPFLDKEPPRRKFKVKIHRGKLVDIKAMYKGESEKQTHLSTMCQIRYDTYMKNSRVVKKSLNPQWRAAAEVAGHGDIMEINIVNKVRFGKEVGPSGVFTKGKIFQSWVLIGRCIIPLEKNVNVKEQWYKLEQRDKSRTRGHTAVTGEIKVSIQEHS